MRHIVFILNPNAGSQSLSDFEATLAEVFNENTGIDRDTLRLETMMENSTDDLRERLREKLSTEEVDTVAVVGGDGSIMEVLPVLVDFPHVRLGLVPYGTGNLLAVNLSIPLATKEALTIILNGEPHPLDLGKIGDRHYFALLAGIGVVADIMENTSSSHKKLFGWYAYLLDGIRNVWRGKNATFKLTVDGKPVRGKGVGVVISNAARNMKPCPALTPNAAPDDGLLHVCFVTAKSKREYIPALYEALSQRCDTEHIHYYSAEKIRIETSPRLKVQADGNIIGKTPVDVQIMPAAIHVLVSPEIEEHLQEEAAGQTTPLRDMLGDLLHTVLARD